MKRFVLAMLILLLGLLHPLQAQDQATSEANITAGVTNPKFVEFLIPIAGKILGDVIIDLISPDKSSAHDVLQASVGGVQTSHGQTGVLYKVVRLDSTGTAIENVPLSPSNPPIFYDNERFAIIFVSNTPRQKGILSA